MIFLYEILEKSKNLPSPALFSVDHIFTVPCGFPAILINLLISELGIELRALGLLGKHSTFEPHSQAPSFGLFVETQGVELCYLK